MQESLFQKWLENLYGYDMTNAKCGKSIRRMHEMKTQMLSHIICIVGTHYDVNVDRKDMRCKCELGPYCL